MEQIITSTSFGGFLDSRQGGRPENQDSCGFVDTPFGLLVVVCDGMGGGPGGKTASSMAVEIIINFICQAPHKSNRVELVRTSIKEANSALYALQQEKRALRGMGTTVTLLLINDYSAIVAHAGDSRVYQFRWGKKYFRTQDHSHVGELVRTGMLTEEQARISPQSNVITRALGVKSDVVPEVVELPYEKDDRFVLCTDGVWGAMPEKELVKMLACTKSPSGTLEKTMIHVNDIGIDEGNHHDNFTMALIVANKNSKLIEPMTTRTRNLLLGLTIVCGLSLVGNVILLSSSTGEEKIALTAVENLNIDSLVNSRMKKYDDSVSNVRKHEILEMKEMLEELKENPSRIDTYRHKMDIEDKIDDIIELLEALKAEKAGEKKDANVDRAKRELCALLEELDKEDIGESDKMAKGIKLVLNKLGDSIARGDDKNDPKKKVAGHYDILINKMKEVRKQIK